MAISAIKDRGRLEDERVIFKVDQEGNLGRFVVFKTSKITENAVSSTMKNTFWFPDKVIRKGDLVVLYTKFGADTEVKNNDGTTTHFTFWKSSDSLWSAKEDTVGLIEIFDWQFKNVEDTK